jgi:hypothetical protein
VTELVEAEEFKKLIERVEKLEKCCDALLKRTTPAKLSEATQRYEQGRVRAAGYGRG